MTVGPLKIHQCPLVFFFSQIMVCITLIDKKNISKQDMHIYYQIIANAFDFHSHHSNNKAIVNINAHIAQIA